MFRSEADLVEFYRHYLSMLGIETQSEVAAGEGGFRADIVSWDNGGCVWEAKQILDRPHLYQALGQGCCYRQYLGVERVALIGLCPVDPNERRQAMKQAQWMQQADPFLQVIFVSEDEQFRTLVRKQIQLKEEK